MARFVLQPCKVRDGFAVPAKGEGPVTLDWNELAVRLAPSATPEALRTLMRLQVGGFVGLVNNRNHPKPSNFLLVNPNRSGSLAWILKQNPGWEDRLHELYRIEEVQYDAKTTEAKGTPDKLGPAKYDPMKPVKHAGAMV